KAGQVLATFSTDSVQADVAQARASLLEAQANAADAAANAERARSLQSSGALSTQQINQYQTTEKTARARAEAAQAVLGAQQLRGRQTQVLAPDSGVISARTATVGSVVGSGAELFRMIRQGRLEWRAEVTSAELGRIGVGTPVRVVPASGGELRGRVRMVAPSVDPQTRAALVYVDLPPMTTAGAAARRAGPPQASAAPSGGSAVREATSVGAALPGMFARGEFELGATDALTVPQRALVVRDGFNYLFQLGEGNRVSQLKVQTGRLAGERVEVVSGLPADARIVVNGAGFLNDGDLVRLSQENESNKPPVQAASTPAAIKEGAAP
ncbi:MAG: efflux RND transporter periplasmic adaptor subunit, partial [Polaromonas sp.]